MKYGNLHGARKCAHWLQFCLSIGWQKSDLGFLEKLWLEYHDDYGRLKQHR